jgi:hypothetical protein
VTARTTGPEAIMGDTLAGRLPALGTRGVLVQMAQRGQIIELRCEMPKCYCHKGRGYFEPRSTPLPDWAPSPDHYPRLKADGGHLVPLERPARARALQPRGLWLAYEDQTDDRERDVTRGDRRGPEPQGDTKATWQRHVVSHQCAELVRVLATDSGFKQELLGDRLRSWPTRDSGLRAVWTLRASMRLCFGDA